MDTGNIMAQQMDDLIESGIQLKNHLEEEAEKIILEHTASTKWGQIKMMNWTTAEVIELMIKFKMLTT
jgi:hypothetical protein